MLHEKEITTFLDLLRCSVTDRQPAVPPPDADWDFIYKIASSQRLTSTLYFGLRKLPKETTENIPHWESYILSYKKALVADANRAFEIQNITTELTKSGIDFIFLKGSVTKYLYPDPAMRPMTDIDALYRGCDFQRLETIFKNQGYLTHTKDPDGISFFKPVNKIKVEMQQMLIDRGYVTWYGYLKDIWEHCALKDGASHEYEISPEYFYLYHIIHMAKHFRKGGLGLNQCMDIYMLQNADFVNNWDFIEKELSHLGLMQFHENLKLLIDFWFHDKKLSANEQQTVDLLLDYILRNGAFGSKVQEEVNQAVQNKKRRPALLSKIFPDYHTMDSYYGGALSRHRFLLPFYWVRLNVKRLIVSRKDFVKLRSSLASVTDTQMEQTRELMQRCGFDA